MGNGTETVPRVFGIARVPTVKGQGLPAWEPRTLRGMGITYASSPQGADHTAGLVTAQPAELPHTGSSLPLVGLSGLVLLILGIGIAALRRT